MKKELENYILEIFNRFPEGISKDEFDVIAGDISEKAESMYKQPINYIEDIVMTDLNGEKIISGTTFLYQVDTEFEAKCTRVGDALIFEDGMSEFINEFWYEGTDSKISLIKK